MRKIMSWMVTLDLDSNSFASKCSFCSFWLLCTFLRINHKIWNYWQILSPIARRFWRSPSKSVSFFFFSKNKLICPIVFQIWLIFTDTVQSLRNVFSLLNSESYAFMRASKGIKNPPYFFSKISCLEKSFKIESTLPHQSCSRVRGRRS